MLSQTKYLKKKFVLSFNFAITNIYVAVRVTENGTRIGIYFHLSSSNISASNKRNKKHSVVFEDRLAPN